MRSLRLFLRARAAQRTTVVRREFSNKSTGGLVTALELRPFCGTGRESPFPVAFFSSPWGWSPSSLLHTPLARAGFTTADVSLPGFGRASAWSDRATLDDAVESLHACFRQLDAAPVVIAPSHAAILVQYYLESYPVAGVVLLSPFSSTTLDASLRRWTGQPAPPASAIAAFLRACVSTEAAARASVLSPDVDEEAVAECLEASESAAMVDGTGSGLAHCGIDAAARMLELMAAAQPPLRGEGIPVPTLCITGASDLLVTSEEAAAEAARHSLATSGDIVVLPAPAPHLVGYGGPAARDKLVETVVEWISARW